MGLIRNIAVLLLVCLLCLPGAPPADQAQYFYDELGRLVGVIDGQGKMAVYNYDEVGNLVSIDRPGQAGAIGIFLIAPASGLVGAQVEIRGFGFDATPSNSVLKFNGTQATIVSATGASIVATVPNGATTGPVTVAVPLAFATEIGRASCRERV